MYCVPSIFSLLSQRRLRWLGHVYRMDAKRIPRNMLYGQLATGSRRTGRPLLRFKDACKRDMRGCPINTDGWEQLASNRPKWRQTVKSGVAAADAKRSEMAADKRDRRNYSASSTPGSTESSHVCSTCGRVCKSRIGLFSHSRRCGSSAT